MCFGEGLWEFTATRETKPVHRALGGRGCGGGVMPPWKKRDTSEEVDETASGVKMARQNL